MRASELSSVLAILVLEQSATMYIAAVLFDSEASWKAVLETSNSDKCIIPSLFRNH